MILTRYAMSGFKFREEFLDVASLALPGLRKALADSSRGIGTGCDVEQSLVGDRVLDDGLGVAFDGQHDCETW
jgi:hypothetical protein